MKLALDKQMTDTLLVSLGAVVGANARYWLGAWLAKRWGTGFPYGTLVINLTGSLVLGFFLMLTTERLLIDPRWRTVFAVGFLGAYTTFSTYTYESVSLIQAGRWELGLLNLLGGALLGALAAGAGMLLGRWV